MAPAGWSFLSGHRFMMELLPPNSRGIKWSTSYAECTAHETAYLANTCCLKRSDTSRWALAHPDVRTLTDDVVITAPGVRLLLGRSPTTTAVLCCTFGLGLGCTLTLGLAGWLFGEPGTTFGEFGGTDTFGGVTDRLGAGATFEIEGDGAGGGDWELELDPLEHPASANAPTANPINAFLISLALLFHR